MRYIVSEQALRCPYLLQICDVIIIANKACETDARYQMLIRRRKTYACQMAQARPPLHMPFT